MQRIRLILFTAILTGGMMTGDNAFATGPAAVEHAQDIPAPDAPLDEHVTALLEAWGACDTDDCPYDLTDDGTVGAADLAALIDGQRPDIDAGRDKSDMAAGTLPIEGRPVPEFAFLDEMVPAWMNEIDSNAALVGIMYDDAVVYLRGFGWLDEDAGIPFPESAKVRIASVVKPMTAAIVREMISDPNIDLSLDDHAFDLGQTGGGVLDINPWEEQGDDRLENITIEHLIQHRGGWDRDVAGDHTTKECDIADDMDIDGPVSRQEMMSWILGQELIHTPGTEHSYSNEGYLALGLIVDELAPDGYIQFLENRILSPDIDVPETEVSRARTRIEYSEYREPVYLDDLCLFCDALTNCGSPVLRPYGIRDIEARLSHGGVRATAQALLRFADTYRLNNAPVTGMPLEDAPLGPSTTRDHGGAQSGVSTFLVQRGDGVRMFIFFNVRETPNWTARRFYNGNNDEFNHEAYLGDGIENFDELFDSMAGHDWPDEAVDGFWTSVDGVGSGGYGGYHQPFLSFGFALQQVTAGSRIRLLPGSLNASGTIDTPMTIDAPLGTAIIGQ